MNVRRSSTFVLVNAVRFALLLDRTKESNHWVHQERVAHRDVPVRPESQEPQALQEFLAIRVLLVHHPT